MPEDIEKRLRELIGGTFYSVDSQAAVCAVWNRSDAFSFEINSNNSTNNGQPEIFGVTLLFELMEFPIQVTTDPDPIQGANEWTKTYFPKLMIIGRDNFPPIWKPTDECPAVYWRFVGYDTDRESYAASWLIGQFAVHIISDSVEERNKWLKAIAERLQADGEIILRDSSPMFIKQVEIKHNSDPLREGQLVLSGQYGVLTQHRKEEAKIMLNNINYNAEVEKVAKTTTYKDKERINDEQSDAKINTGNSVYSVDELAGAARKVFNVQPEIVRTALKMTGKTKATIEETNDIVKKFLSREVK